MAKRFAKSQAELAAILKVSRSALATWSHLGAPTSSKDRTPKGYNVAAVRRWAAENGHSHDEVRATPGRKPTIDGGASANRALRQAQAEERGFRARIAELELKQLEGELIPVIEVEAHDRRRHEYMLGTLENWARALGPVLAGKTALEINRVMVQKVQEVMAEFAGR